MSLEEARMEGKLRNMRRPSSAGSVSTATSSGTRGSRASLGGQSVDSQSTHSSLADRRQRGEVHISPRGTFSWIPDALKKPQISRTFDSSLVGRRLGRFDSDPGWAKDRMLSSRSCYGADFLASLSSDDRMDSEARALRKELIASPPPRPASARDRSRQGRELSVSRGGAACEARSVCRDHNDQVVLSPGSHGSPLIYRYTDQIPVMRRSRSAPPTPVVADLRSMDGDDLYDDYDETFEGKRRGMHPLGMRQDNPRGKNCRTPGRPFIDHRGAYSHDLCNTGAVSVSESIHDYL